METTAERILTMPATVGRWRKDLQPFSVLRNFEQAQLYAVLVRENFHLPIIGTVVGAASMASSRGMTLGPLAGGVIFDRYGTFGWLYAGSVLVGLGAAVIMLTFRPAQPPKETSTCLKLDPFAAE
jgi:MFS family permease